MLVMAVASLVGSLRCPSEVKMLIKSLSLLKGSRAPEAVLTNRLCCSSGLSVVVKVAWHCWQVRRRQTLFKRF